MLSEEKRKELAELIERTQLQGMAGSRKAFELYDIIDSLDMSIEVKTEIFKRILQMVAKFNMMVLDLIVIDDKLEA